MTLLVFYYLNVYMAVILLYQSGYIFYKIEIQHFFTFCKCVIMLISVFNSVFFNIRRELSSFFTYSATLLRIFLFFSFFCAFFSTLLYLSWYVLYNPVIPFGEYFFFYCIHKTHSSTVSFCALSNPLNSHRLIYMETQY